MWLDVRLKAAPLYEGSVLLSRTVSTQDSLMCSRRLAGVGRKAGGNTDTACVKRTMYVYDITSDALQILTSARM